MMILMYCRKCGRIVLNSYDKEEFFCDCCNSFTYKVPEKYLDVDLKFMMNGNEAEQLLIEELVKTAPEFDQYLFDNKDRIRRGECPVLEPSSVLRELKQQGHDKGNQYGIECPYCRATNVTRISAGSKAVHTALFGIFSVGRNSKQWHCNHCKSDF